MISSFSGDFSFLSNFWPAAVEFEGMVFPSVEHAYQAAKTVVAAEREAIQRCETPGQAKRMGSRVTVRPEWETVKVEVMFGLLRQKFAQPELARLLAETAPQALVEGNTWHDRFWGVCSCQSCVGQEQRNILGQLLMSLRDTNDAVLSGETNT